MIPILIGVLLLLLVPHPWNGSAFAVALAWEIVGILLGCRWSQRRPALVGIDTLVGCSAVVVKACRPAGQVKLQGETWIARSEAGIERGERVRVRAVNGLTLLVEPDPAS